MLTFSEDMIDDMCTCTVFRFGAQHVYYMQSMTLSAAQKTTASALVSPVSAMPVTHGLRYRWRIVGHRHMLEQIERDITDDNLAHAYLLSGPPQVGKYTVAKTLAHILQCERDFCHTCATCSEIDKGIHSDTIEMRDDGDTISVEMMRDLIARLSLTSSTRYKIVLIERIERMTKEAANCFLKTLEEPTPHTMFLLTTDTVREVLPTVVSRVRVLSFGTCDKEALVEHLSGEYASGERAVDRDALALISELSLGRPGIAFKLLENPELLDFYKSLYRDLSRFLAFNNVFERMAYVQPLIDDKERIGIFLDIFTHIVRKELLHNPTNGRRYVAILDSIDFTRRGFKHHVNPRLALETLMISF